MLGKTDMERWAITLPELDRMIDALAEGSVHRITRRDYERLSGTNGAAMGRLRNFAKGHHCVASFADGAVVLRRQPQPSPKAPWSR